MNNNVTQDDRIASKLIMGNFDKCREPFLSILIPSFRGCQYMFQAIDSALNQEAAFEYEVIVVYNDPCADLSEVKLRYKDKENIFLYQNEANIGMVGNSNRCVELARGKYIAFLHDDDYLMKDYMLVVNKYLSGADKIDCLLTGRLVEYEGKRRKSDVIKWVLRNLLVISILRRKKVKEIYLENCLKSGTNIYFSPSCGTVISKQKFEDLGGFDSSIAYSFDLDFFLRFNAKYAIYETTEVCAVYRIGNNASLKSDVKWEFFDYYRGRFFDIMEQNNVCLSYINKHRNDFIYIVYKQLGRDIQRELSERNEHIEKIGFFKLLIYRLKTALYFYSHNLDIQRPR